MRELVGVLYFLFLMLLMGSDFFYKMFHTATNFKYVDGKNVSRFLQFEVYGCGFLSILSILIACYIHLYLSIDTDSSIPASVPFVAASALNIFYIFNNYSNTDTLKDFILRTKYEYSLISYMINVMDENKWWSYAYQLFNQHQSGQISFEHEAFLPLIVTHKFMVRGYYFNTADAELIMNHPSFHPFTQFVYGIRSEDLLLRIGIDIN